MLFLGLILQIGNYVIISNTVACKKMMDNQLDRRRLMRNKVTKIIAIVIILIFGGTYMYNKLTKPNLGPKTAKLYQHGFRLLEEQIGTYIKEHYTGIEKIEFSPIYVTGDDGSSMLNAEVVPIVYDSHGNKAIFGGLYKNFQHPAYGIIGSLRLDFDYPSKESIELKTDSGEFVSVVFGKPLPRQALRTFIDSIDENFQTLIEEEKIKDVKQSSAGSPNAEIIYNTELKKGSLLDGLE